MTDRSADGPSEFDDLEARGISCADFFDGQFVFSPGGVKRFSSWTEISLCGGILQISPALPHGTLVDREGRRIGHRLGIAIDPVSGVLADRHALPCDTGDLSAVEDWAATLAGRYLLFLDLPTKPCVIGDPIGDLGLVYCPKAKRAAATLLLALDRPIVENPRLPHDLTEDTASFYTLGQTRDAEAFRLTPNHRLDLGTWTETRFWPRTADVFAPDGYRAKFRTRQIIRRLRHNATSVIDAFPTFLPLSSGRDSRNLLAVIGRGLPRLAGAYYHHYDNGFRAVFGSRFRGRIRTGMKVAMQVAEAANVPLTPISEPPLDEDLEDYPLRTGYVKSNAQPLLMNTFRSLPEGHVCLLGNVMEILRANQWRRHPPGPAPVKSHAFQELLRLPPELDALSRIWDGWRQEIGPLAGPHLYEMQFVEHLLPNTLGPKHYAIPHLFFMSPFADRALIVHALNYPLEDRLKDVPNSTLLSMAMHKLKDIPFR